VNSLVQSRVVGSHIDCEEGWAQSAVDRHGVSLASYAHAIFGLGSTRFKGRIRTYPCVISIITPIAKVLIGSNA